MPDVRRGPLKEDEILRASTTISTPPEAVYAIASDVTRIPEWSLETVRVEREDAGRFRSWNRRRLGVWRTPARVTVDRPGVEFTFVVEALGKDWTEWSYLVEPGPTPGTTVLTERFRMCMDLPFAARVFECLFLFVGDRRSDLQVNLQHSVDRIRAIAEQAAQEQR